MRTVLRKFIRYFFQGVLFIAPAGLTIYIVYMLFNFVDTYLQSIIQEYLPFNIPGVGILLLIALITVLGFVAQSILFRPIKAIIDRVMKNVPFVKVLYSALHDLFSAFMGSEKKFDKPVLVKVNTISELEKIGFITSEDLSELNISGKVAVYFPHSYNFSGEMFIVPKEHIKLLDIPSSEAMKFIVSGGVTKV